MRNILKVVATVLLATMILAACGGNNDTNGSNDDVLQVISTFTLIEDMVEQIGGEHVDIHNLVPVGTDPHEYEPLPEDTKAVEDADILFYNGMNLEGGDGGWFMRLVESANQSEDVTFELSDGVEPMNLTSATGEIEVNPHTFLSPKVGIVMTENVRDALIEVDPDNKEVYEENAEKYLSALKEIDKEYETQFDKIPEENRIIVTSERAYQYLAEHYGLKEGFIYAVDTEEGGTPDQITSLVEFINENNPPVLFVESNVDPRPMETVSEETGVDIYGEPLFSDEIGQKGETGDTYIKYLEYNIEKIYEGLTSN